MANPNCGKDASQGGEYLPVSGQTAPRSILLKAVHIIIDINII
jgi:hypothetical protein